MPVAAFRERVVNTGIHLVLAFEDSHGAPKTSSLKTRIIENRNFKSTRFLPRDSRLIGAARRRPAMRLAPPPAENAAP
jgi:hypothetical protein